MTAPLMDEVPRDPAEHGAVSRASATGPGALRGLLARLLGWTDERAVEGALRSVKLAVNRDADLVLCGAGDMVPIARALHRRSFGDDRAFAVADPRRGDGAATIRSPANYKSGLRALDAVRGGSLCVLSWRLPRDFASVVARLRHGDDVVLIVCSGERKAANPLLVRPAPISVPPLAGRGDELSRIIDEYALDAIAELGAEETGFTEADHAWVRVHDSGSLAEIERATLRLVAIRAARSASAAAVRLGMAPVSLLLWLSRRRVASPMTRAHIEPCSSIESTTTLAHRGNHGSHR